MVNTVKYKPVNKKRGKAKSSTPSSTRHKALNNSAAKREKSSKAIAERNDPYSTAAVADSFTPPSGEVQGGDHDGTDTASVREVMEMELCSPAVNQDIMKEARISDQFSESENMSLHSESESSASEYASESSEAESSDVLDELSPRESKWSLLKTIASSKRLTRLATLSEDDQTPMDDPKVVLSKTASKLCKDASLAEAVGMDTSTLESLKVLSGKDMANDTESSDSECSDDEEDELESEMSAEIAKTWGLFTKAIRDTLAENLEEELVTTVLHVLAPTTIEFSSLMAKCTMVGVIMLFIVFYDHCGQLRDCGEQ